jgi:putative aldouronate transport system substrate-binding protein
MMPVLQIYADFFAEGYIAPGFTTLTGGPLGEQLTSDRIAAISSATWLPGWPLAMAFDADETDWIIQPILPSETLQGPLMVQADVPAGRLSSVRQGFAHPEAIFKIFNFQTAMLYDDDLADLETYHGRGGDSPFGFAFSNPMQNPTTHRNLTNFARNNRDESFLHQAHDFQALPGFVAWLDQDFSEIGRGGAWSNFKTWYGDNSTWGILTNYMERGQLISNRAVGVMTPTMMTNWADLLDLEDTFTIEVVTGQRPVSDFEDFFIPTWNAMGGSIITGEINDWWRARN